MPQKCTICGGDLTTEEVFVCKQPHDSDKPKIGSAVLSCPLSRGGIWVHVVDDLGKGVPTIPVTDPKSGPNKDTDASGYSPFDPLDAGTAYNVTIGPLPPLLKDKYFLPATTTAPNIPVQQGQITEVEFQLQRACKLEVKIHETEDENALVKGIDVTLTGPTVESAVDPPAKQTPVGGIVSWEPLRKAAGYQAKITVPQSDIKKYVIEGPDTQTSDVQPDRDNKLVFKVTPLTWVKVIVSDKDAEAIVEEQARKAAHPSAKVKLTLLDTTLDEKPATKAEEVEWMMKKKNGGKCALNALSIDHSGAPEAEPVWYLEELTTA